MGLEVHMNAFREAVVTHRPEHGDPYTVGFITSSMRVEPLAGGYDGTRAVCSALQSAFDGLDSLCWLGYARERR